MIKHGKARFTRGRVHALVVCCLMLVLAAACGLPDVGSTHREASVVEVPRPGLAEGVFPIVEPRVTEGPVAEHFSRELPGSVADFEATWADYPSAHVRRGLCAGDQEILSRFEQAVGAAVAAGDDPAVLRETYGDLLEWCQRPEQCAWAMAAVEAGGGAAEVAWVALAQCPGAAVQALFERGGAPADTLIEYWAGRSWGDDYTPRLNPHMVAALSEVAAAGDVWKTRAAAVLVSDAGEPAAETLLALWDSLPAGEVRDQIVPSFIELDHPRAKELFAEYCSRSADTDAVCSSDWSPLQGLIEPGSESPPSDCAGHEGLEQLLADGDPQALADTSACLYELAESDRAAAVAEARTILPWDVGFALAGWLDAFPEHGQLEAALRELGLLPRGPLPGTEVWRSELGLPPGEVLAGSGPVYCFDLETGQFPNQHDRLLYDLAELAGPPLNVAFFEEEAPPFELADGSWMVGGRKVDVPPLGIAEGTPYRLRAYLGGRQYETDAQDFGDWYDLDRVLGLLNAVATAQGATARAVTLPTSDQTACVLLAPGEAILAGIQAGLLEVGTGGATERARELERQMLEQLVEQGDLEDFIAEPR